MARCLLVTGGAGFIGSHFVERALENNQRVVVIDKLHYGFEENLPRKHPNLTLLVGDIQDQKRVLSTLKEYQVSSVVHFAAESHVDRSIAAPKSFIDSNILGTFSLLQAALEYLKGENESVRKTFRFLHISTDEVFGSLGDQDFFSEKTPYDPSSPYSASKASSDFLVRAWHRSFGLPVLITNCSNNFGPRQFPEKLIPLMIYEALQEKPLPVYGKGENIRDWIFVKDHCRAVELVLDKGKLGETYCVGGRNEKRNIDLVHMLCEFLDQMKPRRNSKSYKELIRFVSDRPGHDYRYAIDDSKIRSDLGYRESASFEENLKLTIGWYLENTSWAKSVIEKMQIEPKFEWSKIHARI